MEIIAGMWNASRITAWSTFAIAILALIGIGGLVITRRVLQQTRNAVKESVTSRHAQLLVDMDRWWDSDHMVKLKRSLKGVSTDELKEKWASLEAANAEEFYQLMRFANFFEHLGALYKFECLEISWIDEMLGSPVMGYWRLWQGCAHADRDRWPKVYENWENLAKEIAKRRGLSLEAVVT